MWTERNLYLRLRAGFPPQINLPLTLMQENQFAVEKRALSAKWKRWTKHKSIHALGSNRVHGMCHSSMA